MEEEWAPQEMKRMRYVDAAMELVGERARAHERESNRESKSELARPGRDRPPPWVGPLSLSLSHAALIVHRSIYRRSERGVESETNE